MRYRTMLMPEEDTGPSPAYSGRGNAAPGCYTALVTLNQDCNLACPYCSRAQFSSRSYMSKATADLLVETILAGPFKTCRELLLDFRGGEPLLSLPLIGRIIGPLHEASLRSGTPFSYTLVTNGTLLTRRIVNVLRPLGLAGARITIDGPPDIHNRQRPFVTGSGSFDLIVENLKEVCGRISVQLGGNFTRENYRRFPELLDLLEREGISPDTIEMVQFSPAVPAAGEAGSGGGSGEPWLIEASLYLQEEIRVRGWNTPRTRPAVATVECKNDLSITWDGAIYKSPVFMGPYDLKIDCRHQYLQDFQERIVRQEAGLRQV